MKEILKVLREYINKNGIIQDMTRGFIKINIYSDGSGTVSQDDSEFFMFNNIEELIEKLNS